MRKWSRFRAEWFSSGYLATRSMCASCKSRKKHVPVSFYIIQLVRLTREREINWRDSSGPTYNAGRVTRSYHKLSSDRRPIRSTLIRLSALSDAVFAITRLDTYANSPLSKYFSNVNAISPSPFHVCLLTSLIDIYIYIIYERTRKFFLTNQFLTNFDSFWRV